MKINYLIRVALCCFLMVACQNNDPNKADGKANTEITNQLSDIMDSIGKIISTKNFDDGSIVMTDDKGNTITKDKDGNIIIVMATGETITIDNSVYEDTTIAKDKWYHSTWKGRVYHELIIVPNNEDPQKYKRTFIDYLKNYGFNIQNLPSYTVDSTKTHQNSVDYINLHFNYTTCSWQHTDSVTETTETGTYTYTKYRMTEQQVGDYKLVIKNYGGYENHAYIIHNDSALYHCPIDADSTLTIESEFSISNRTEKLTTSVNTTFFNYRRVNDTQIALINNSTSYLLKEENSSNMPEMDVYQDGKSQSIYLKLVSL